MRDTPVRLRAAARAWIADDPDPADRAELGALLRAGDDGELAARFAQPLTFGTAGIRGPLGAGPGRMNRAIVRRVAAGLARYLRAAGPELAGRPVVIGFDARRGSQPFAAEAAAVLTGAGPRVLSFGAPVPTPVLAFAVGLLHAAAGLMITASHNPREDNGAKVYWADGAQIIPPEDAGIAAAAEQAGPLASVPLGGPGEPLGAEVIDAYLDAVVPAALPADRPPGGKNLAERTYRDVLPGAGVVPGVRPRDGDHGTGAVPGFGLRDAVPRARALPGDPVAARQALRVAYTPLHGVGLGTLLRAFARAGFAEPAVVAAQAQPDGAFPTVPRPNPEEPGVLDLLMAEGDRSGADLLLANDPDADRLAAVVPGPAGGWRVLTGDEIGALLAGHRLRHESQPGRRLLVTTVVSADLLGRMAAAAGAGYAETLTGFKWIMRAADGEVGRSFLFGYEEALGYAVTDQVRDKDGMSAAIVLADAAAEAKSEGGSLATRLDDLARRFGLFVTGQFSVELAGGGEDEEAGEGAGEDAGEDEDADEDAEDEDEDEDAGEDEGAGKGAGNGAGAGLLEEARARPPVSLLGQPVAVVDDLGLGLRSRADGTKDPLALPRSDVIIWRCADGTKVAVRPSGTEPKVKIYLQVVLPAAGHDDLGPLRAQAARRLARLREEVTEVLNL
jgi:phosphomannomutase